MSLEFQILNRMIFRLEHEPFFRWVERWPLSHRPGLEDAAYLQTKIEVQHGSVVLLHDEAMAIGLPDAPARLWRPPEVSLLVIGLKAHALRSMRASRRGVRVS